MVSSYILPNILDYAIPPLFHLALLLLSLIQPYQLWLATSFLATFSRLYLFASGHISSSALDIVLLVVLEHPSTLLAAVFGTVSSCFTNFVFPSHTSPAYSSFGTITLIRIHLLLASRCESVRIASILPTLSYHVCSCVHPKSILLRYLRQGTYIGLRSVIHLLPTSIRKLPSSPYRRYT